MFKLWNKYYEADVAVNKLGAEMNAAVEKQARRYSKLKRTLQNDYGLPKDASEADLVARVKRITALERNDARMELALHTDEQFFKLHFWKFVKKDGGDLHCTNRHNCAYLHERELERYTGYWVCTLDATVHFCDHCFILNPHVHDISEWKHLLSKRESLADITHEEIVLCAYDDVEKRAKYRAEWRRFEGLSSTRCNECTFQASHVLRGSTHALCLYHFDKKFHN